MALSDTYSIDETAKLLGVGRKKLFALLRELHVLNCQNVPYQRYLDAGYFRVYARAWHHEKAGLQHYAKTLVTARGVAWLQQIVGTTDDIAQHANTTDQQSTDATR